MYQYLEKNSTHLKVSTVSKYFKAYIPYPTFQYFFVLRLKMQVNRISKTILKETLDNFFYRVSPYKYDQS